MAEIHSRAKMYDNKTEHLFSFLQVMTACTASFAHGSNDVSNAIGPYSAIYEVWSTSLPVGKNTPIPVWMLAFGGAMIVVGLATYGYNIMRILGNRMTLMSPSRGFSMELGASITVLLASQFGIPVSSTMCITGATLGVAMCNGDRKSPQPHSRFDAIVLTPPNFYSWCLQLARARLDLLWLGLDCPNRFHLCRVPDVCLRLHCSLRFTDQFSRRGILLNAPSL